ncbi:MAG: phosphatase PAP2 family protein [Chitinophagaceae bacterium]|nr:MAG: phosphatase PAP2 family protein [Chitinophagaceae bacterium]
MMRNTVRHKFIATTIFLQLCLFSFLIIPVQAQQLSVDTEVPKPERTSLLPRASDSGQVYRMNYWRSLGFSALATAANLYAIPNLIKDKKPLTDAELQALNPNIFSDFDKWALNQDIDHDRRGKIDVTSDRILTLTSVGAAALFLDKKIRKDWLRILALYVETSGATFSVYNFSPFGALFNNKIRPLAYYDNFPLELRKDGNSRNSFYSGHVANAAASTFFMAKVYSDYHPELGGKKYLLYGLATLPPLLISYLRVKALFHFPTDCLVGLIIGGSMGVLVPETHRIKNKGFSLGMASMSGVPAVALKWKL